MDTQTHSPRGPEPLRFRFGAPVHAAGGGALGTLCQVLLEPQSLRLTGLVVRSGFFFLRELKVPLGAVISATADEIRLDWSAPEAAERSEKQRRLLRAQRSRERSRCGRGARAPWEAPETLAIPDALKVESLHGGVGHLRQVLVERTSGGVSEFVIEVGLFSRRSLRLAAEWVRSITREALTVNALPSGVHQLPLYRTDQELRADILDACFYDHLLRPLLLRDLLNVKVHEGVATLEGYVSSPSIRRRVASCAQAAPGILEVRSEVVTDAELAHRVASALAEDTRTQMLRPRVYSVHGVITLEGEASDPARCEAAVEVAGGVPRVRGVVNRLQVPGREPPGHGPREPDVGGPGTRLQPRVGQQVYTREGPFGRVARVILDARDRRVTGMVVAGELPGPEAVGSHPYPQEWPRRERSVVIPAEAVFATPHQILLRLTHAEAAVLPGFDPGEYRQPDPTWVPPFPYGRPDVLFAMPWGAGVATSQLPREGWVEDRALLGASADGVQPAGEQPELLRRFMPGRRVAQRAGSGRPSRVAS